MNTSHMWFPIRFPICIWTWGIIDIEAPLPGKWLPCFENRCQSMRNQGLRLPPKKSNPDQVKWRWRGVGEAWWQLITVSAQVVVMGPIALLDVTLYTMFLKQGLLNFFFCKKLHNVSILVFMGLYHRFLFLFTSTIFKYVKAIAQRHTRTVL